MSAKTGILVVLIISAAALIYTVTTRLSDQTLDTLVGLACGVAATIPISAGLLIALTRKRREPRPEHETITSFREPHPSNSAYPHNQPYPPVIVVTPQQGQWPNPFGGLLSSGAPPPNYQGNEPRMGRDFKIIGEDDGFDA